MGWWPDALNPLKKGSRPMSQKQYEQKRQIMMLTGEVEAMGDMFTRMNRQCYQKCMAAAVVDGSARSDELSLDDEKCLESCAVKFVATQNLVGEAFLSANQDEAAKMQM
mmetsp:Transcript_66000/g.137476  ORF Transcript_66000/g.137476 Transcript_66000/m.137476 type:complete len:109 (+) Transcript_66000:222-548(+)|eukprot:CAMPEP_0181298860 /NCGR_PEP_ID=MMETSP1101-20121128/6018_1 /TAXON_ID=46948 /ORGANISM="Rhodomonas abbreviata, Strain Caron Lab Isolate" /LENGTH=108 /DNA_ID=CAMNT_0023403931 /DNA_START=222 /DNA_END=548 /DNA_ORIENTATION=+